MRQTAVIYIIVFCNMVERQVHLMIMMVEQYIVKVQILLYPTVPSAEIRLLYGAAGFTA